MCFSCSWSKNVLKLSWNLVKSWSWNFTLSCWDPCNSRMQMTWLCVCRTVQMQLYTQRHRIHGDERPTSDSPETNGCSHADFKFDVTRFFVAAASARINCGLPTSERHRQSLSKSHYHVLRFRFWLVSGTGWPFSGADHYRQPVLNICYQRRSTNCGCRGIIPPRPLFLFLFLSTLSSFSSNPFPLYLFGAPAP